MSDLRTKGFFGFILIVSIVLFSGALILHYVYGVGTGINDNPRWQKCEITKNVTVSSKYVRSDAYMNHFPPYFVTTDGEIYDIDNDMIWASLMINQSYKICYNKGSAYGGRQRAGEIVKVLP